MSAITSVAATLCRISAGDNAAITRVIRKVSAEYGLTANKGYTVADLNLGELFQVYNQPGAAYRVVKQDGKVVGGGGVVPLECNEPGTCELQKVYLLSSTHGQGLARKLALMALERACEQGFKQCYPETTAFLTEAIRLYEHLGFEHINGALDYTGHVDCKVWMLKPL